MRRRDPGPGAAERAFRATLEFGTDIDKVIGRSARLVLLAADEARRDKAFPPKNMEQVGWWCDRCGAYPGEAQVECADHAISPLFTFKRGGKCRSCVQRRLRWRPSVIPVIFDRRVHLQWTKGEPWLLCDPRSDARQRARRIRRILQEESV